MGSYMNYTKVTKEAKSLTFGRGSEVSHKLLDERREVQQLRDEIRILQSRARRPSGDEEDSDTRQIQGLGFNV